MDKTESRRLAKMEQRQEDMAADIVEIKELLKAQDQKFARFVDAAETKFITRLEGKAAALLLSVIITLITVFLNIKDHIK